MTNKDFKKVIKYLMQSCPNLTNKQVGKLYGLQFVAVFSLRDIRSVYRIAIDNCVSPVCPWCKMPIVDSDDLTIDHIYPKSLGGSDGIHNLQPMHRKCNEEKGASLPKKNRTFGAPSPAEVHKHIRSEKEKYRAHNRHVIIKDTNVDSLMEKCDRYDAAKCHMMFCNKNVKKR